MFRQGERMISQHDSPDMLIKHLADLEEDRVLSLVQGPLGARL